MFLYPLGVGPQFGLTEVGVPGLADCLVYDKSRLYLVARTTDFEIAMSQDYFFDSDSAAIRVRGRFAVGMPVPLKAARKVTVAGVDRTAAAEAEERRQAARAAREAPRRRIPSGRSSRASPTAVSSRCSTRWPQPG